MSEPPRKLRDLTGAPSVARPYLVDPPVYLSARTPPHASPPLSRYFSPAAPSRYPEAFGFRSEAQSVHGSRTIMLADLSALLAALPPSAEYGDYERAIMEDNVLGKPTASTRLWAWKKLRELYALDLSVPIFRLLRHLWNADPQANPVLALLAAMARDALLRASAEAITSAKSGEAVTKDRLRDAIVRARGDRFSKSTMEAVLSHLASSWTDSGHLAGKNEKVRVRTAASPAATAYALALGYMAGARGILLFSTLWTSVLDAPEPVLHDHAREASRRGWLTYRGIGDVVDITFERLLTPAELRELASAS